MWDNLELVKRYNRNPILLPKKENKWESKLVYNCAAFKLDKIIYLVYRAMGEEHISRFGLAYSKDGIIFERLSYPVFTPKTYYEKPHSTTLELEREKGGVEDPRAIIIGEYIYLTYTAFHKACHIALARMRIVDFKKIIEKSICNNMDFTDEWNNLWQREGLIFPEMFNDRDTFSRNSVLMPLGEELFLLFYRINKGDILVSLSNKPEGSWKESGIQLFTRKFNWEQERIGISTPPIQIIDNKKQKALLFYHGVKENSANGKIMKIYSLGAFFMSSEIKHNKLLLKIERIIKPVLSPLKEYEINNKWLLSVNVHAVFSCGAVPAGEKEVFIYYGAGDSNINLAKLNVDDLLTEEALEEYREIDLRLFGIK